MTKVYYVIATAMVLSLCIVQNTYGQSNNMETNTTRLVLPKQSTFRPSWLGASGQGLGEMNPPWRDTFRHGAYTNNVLFINAGNRLYLMITD